VQVLQAGPQQYLFLELDNDTIQDVVRQSGFEVKFHEHPRHLTLELEAPERRSPLLLFDAADPGNLGWFSRCHFYVDGRSGTVLQTPLAVGNLRDRQGRSMPHGIKLQIARELPSNFRLPGKAPVSEQMVYAVLGNFLNSLVNVGVGVCGASSVRPLAGRGEGPTGRP
jgi:hypothetical protein